MIKFFRRIRQQLLKENKFSKYLLYAVGEIVLVVIGILIALQINTWNEERVKKIVLKEHLKNMAGAMNHVNEGDNLTLLKNINEFRYYSMLYLLDISGHDTNHLSDFEPYNDFVPVEWLWNGKIPTQFDEQFIKAAIKWSKNTTEGGEESETILDKINDEGLFSYIEDPALQKAIEYNYWEEGRRFGIVESQNIKKFKHDWIDAMNSAGFTPEYIKDPKEFIEWLENSPEASAKLYNLVSNAKWLLDSCEFIMEDDKQLMEDINTYLLRKH
jgi:hypothetical protein